MITGQGNELVADYLRRLDAAASRLPADRRAELVDEIRGHIDAALGEAGTDTESAVRNVLGRLGEPAEIVAAAAPEHGVDVTRHDRGPGWLPVVTVLLLVFGGFFPPVLGWIVGVGLLWYSPVWTFRDKLLGTLVWPGGLLTPAFLGLTSAQVCTTTNSPGSVTSTQPGEGSGWVPGGAAESCTGFAFPIWLGLPLMVVSLLAPLVMAVYLLRRARRDAAAQ
jgi:hypothetical protein